MRTFMAVLGDNPRRLVIMPAAGDKTDALYCIGNLPPRYPVPAIYNSLSNPGAWDYMIRFASRYADFAYMQDMVLRYK